MELKYHRVMTYSFIIVILVLIAVRVALPYIALNYVTSEINKTTEYRTKIADINLYLLQGKATVIDTRVWKKNLKISDPFLSIAKVNFSIQWRALLKGKLVGKINIKHPVINFIDTPTSSENKQQAQISEESIKIFKSLMPVVINQATVSAGEIYYKNNQAKPAINLYIKDINITLKNIQNIDGENGLVSSFSLYAKAMESGNLTVQGKFDPLQKIPTFYVKASIKGLSLPELNTYLKKYTDIKTSSGSFSLFFEASAAQGRIKGYAKPFVKNLQIQKEKNSSLGQDIYEETIAAAYKLLKNPKQKSVATQINLSGKIDDPNASVFPLIGYLLHHAFIQALLPTVDNKFSMKDIVYPEKNQEKKVDR